MSTREPRILVLCDHGNNRSVHVAAQLKYLGNDVLTAGLQKNSAATLDMLCHWADRIIVTAADQLESLRLDPHDDGKVELWDIGPDVYPRPFNPTLLKKVRALVQERA